MNQQSQRTNRRAHLMVLACVAWLACAPRALPGQPYPLPEDVATPESLMGALYDTFQRPPGENINWERFASFYAPGALLIPNIEQTDGESRIMSVAEFQAWIEGIFAEHSPIGSPQDHGLAEDEIHAVYQRYGDVVQVMSTYQRRPWDSDEIDGRGVNAFTLVYQDGRWWIVSVAWDEESGAGPIPERYLP